MACRRPQVQSLLNKKHQIAWWPERPLPETLPVRVDKTRLDGHIPGAKVAFHVPVRRVTPVTAAFQRCEAEGEGVLPLLLLLLLEAGSHGAVQLGGHALSILRPWRISLP